MSSIFKIARAGIAAQQDPQRRPVFDGILPDPGDFHWNHVNDFGLPHRTPPNELLRPGELAERSVIVHDFRNATLYTGDPEHNRIYCQIRDNIQNRWWSLVHKELWQDVYMDPVYHVWRRDPHHWVYIEWLVNVMEDGSRTRTPIVSRGYHAVT